MWRQMKSRMERANYDEEENSKRRYIKNRRGKYE